MKRDTIISDCYYRNGISPLIKFIDVEPLKKIENEMRKVFSRLPEQCYDPERGNVIKLHTPIPCLSLYIDVKKILENILQKRLYGSYWYSTLYHNDAFMVSHYDRDACEISVSMNLYRDAEWDLHVLDYNEIDHAVNTPPGYGILYDGINCAHWRDNYTGNEYAQLFLHYLTKPPKILL